MRAVVQRVSRAEVRAEGETIGTCGHGLMVLLGVHADDAEADADWLAAKVAALRIFSDSEGKMNLSVVDIQGGALVVSQFTLHASTKKGNRPSYIKAAKPEIAKPLYEQFVQQFETDLEQTIQTGEFGADMKVALLNDGPVTIIIDTKERG